MKKRFIAIAAATGLAISAGAYGQTCFEDGDAGDMPATAQACEGSGPLAEIQGFLGSSSDADMYIINIVDANSFEATTVFGSTLDTQLFLLDMSEHGVVHNDDDPQFMDGLRSRISSIFIPGPGEYYLAVSNYDTDPVSNGGEIWQDTPWREERMPDGPGAGSPISGWGSRFGASGSYTIFLTGAEFVGGCAPDCDGNGTLNTLDFLCFLNAFNNGDPFADYNGDGTINTLDFLAYLNDFSAGCE